MNPQRLGVSRVVLSLWVLALGPLAPDRASADGGIIISYDVSVEEVPGGTQVDAVEQGMVSSDGQRAVLWLREDGCWDLYIDPGTIEVSSAAWVLPLPVAPEAVEAASADFIDQLDLSTQPVLITRHVERVTHYYEYSDGGGGGGFGCSRASFDSAGGLEGGGTDTTELGESVESSPPVHLWGQGRLGDVTYDLVSSDDPEALSTWLTDNGYLVPYEMEPILGEYVREGAVFFAGRLSRGRGDDETHLPVFRFSLCGLESPSYPMRLTTLSVDRSLDFTLWVVTPDSRSTFVPTNARLGYFDGFYQEETVGWDEPPELPDFESLYLERRDELLDAGIRSLAVEYSNSLSVAELSERVTQLGEDLDRSDWSSELEEAVTSEAWVLRISGHYTLAMMDQDVGFEEGTVEYDNGIYTRSAVEEREVWSGPEDSPVAEEEVDPVFDDASSCQIPSRRRGLGRDLPLVALFGVVIALIFRRARQGRG